MTQFGLPAKTIGQIRTVFAAYPEVKKVTLYGSRAMGNYKNGSDIDLTMHGAYTNSITYTMLARIASQLDDLPIPYTIDLSILDALDHAKLKDHIDRVGKVFYERIERKGKDVNRIKTLAFEKCLEKIKIPPKLKKNKYLKKGTYPVIAQEADFINGYTNNENLLFKVKNSVIIFGDHTRHLKFVNFNFVLGADGAKIIKPIGGIDTRFFYYYLSALMPESLGYARHYRLLRGLKFSIPPLPVQKQIVKKLDAASAGIDTAIAATKQKQNEVEALKNAVLSAELSGNSEDHIDRISKVFYEWIERKGKGIVQGWEVKCLGEVCQITIGKTPFRKNLTFWDQDKNGDNVWLSIADLSRIEGKYIGDSKEYISAEGVKLCKPVKKGTLMMSFKLSIGKLAFAERTLYTNEAIASLAIKNYSLLDKEFLYYFLFYYDWDKETANDIKLKGRTLNKKKLFDIPIPLPPLPVQKQIVKKLDAAFVGIEALKKFNTNKQKLLFDLKSSLLNQAFSGELTKDAA